MISYVTFGVRDIEKSAAFYEGIFKKLDPKMGRLHVIKGIDKETKAEGVVEIIYSKKSKPEAPMFAIIRPFNGESVTYGNGTMVAFSAENEQVVRDVHAEAIRLGAENEGDPGDRADEGIGLTLYLAYFRDLDKNKIAISYIASKDDAI